MTDDLQKQHAPSQGPGAILKQARESKGLTVADIAAKLYLRVVYIEAIEADNYDPAISVTFTKGYLKLYAKQVQVPEHVVIDAFSLLHEKEKEPAKLQSFSRRVAKQNNDDRLMMVTYAIIAILLALVVIWWLQQDSSESANIIESNPASTVNQVDRAIADSELAPTRDDLIVSGQLQAEFDVADDTVNTIDPLSVPSEELLAQQEAAQVSDFEPQGQLIELVFEFAGNCWMKLTDATGEAIAYGEKQGGRVMRVSGLAPFEVTLGAPERVKISYDGVAVDMSRFSTGSSANFTLPFSE
jgi:cytoskeleton protein RodZ